jgi:hypothetical protein
MRQVESQVKVPTFEENGSTLETVATFSRRSQSVVTNEVTIGYQRHLATARST